MGRLIFTLAVLFLATQNVGLEELIFTLDLLVILFHGLEALDKLVNAQVLQVDIWTVQVGYLLTHYKFLPAIFKP